MPQLLPGMDALLSPAIHNLGESLGKLIQPDREFQKNLQATFAQKPELMHTFAKIERESPGTLLRMGFGDKLATTLAQIPETTEQEIARKGRADEVKNAQSKQQLTGVEQQVKKTALEGALKMLMKVGIQEDSGRKILGLDTEAEEGTTKAKQKIVESQVPVAEAQAKLDLKILENGIVVTKDLVNIDVHGLAKNFLSGKQVDASILAGLMSRPDTAKLFIESLEGLRQTEQLNASKIIASTRAAAGGSNGITDTSLFTKAYQSWKDSDKAGSVEAWNLIHTDASGAKEQAEIARKKPVTEQTQDERDLIEAVDADTATETEGRREKASKTVSSLTKAIQGVNMMAKDRKGDISASIAPYMSEIQSLLADNVKLGGKQFEPKYGKIPGTGGWMGARRETVGLYFVDAQGNEYTESDVLGDVQGTTTKSKTFDADLSETVAFLSGIKDSVERNRRIEELTPVLRADVKRHFEAIDKKPKKAPPKG